MKHTDALWNTLLRHQASRLNSATVDLRQIMKSFPHLLPQHIPPESTGNNVLPDVDVVVLDFEDCLKLLAKLLFGDSDSGLERHDRLVTLSHTLYRTFPAEDFQALGPTGDKLHQAIGFLGRLQTSFRVLLAAARQIPGFDDLALIPVVGLKTRKKPLGQQWSVAKTFQALNLPLSDTAVGKLMEPSSSKARWTKNKLLNDFSRLKSPTWEVHAEIQLIIFILSHPEEVANGKRFDYIGCSKYSCLLCSKFLHFFEALKTRGCHGKLYNHSWTVPLEDNLGENEQRMLSETVLKVISWMRKELNASKRIPAQRKLEVKESTIGGSLFSIPGMSQENRQESHAASEHLRRQRAQNSLRQLTRERYVSALNYSSKYSISASYYTEMTLISFSDPVEPEEAVRSQTRHETLAQDTSRLWTGCHDVLTSRRCSRCGGPLFCSEACERRMRLSHLLRCNMRQVTSADYLHEDILVDTHPTDPQVRQDYWFDRFENESEEPKLFGVFAGIFCYHPNPVTREELHRWRSHPGGNPYLVAKIVEKFEELPKHNRGAYFPWFLRHRARFELPDGHPEIPRSPSPTTQKQNMHDRARKYLAPEDRHKDINDLSPPAKLYCFELYSMTAYCCRPCPLDLEVGCRWFDFGFVVTRDEHEEETLGSMYSDLLFGSKTYEDFACEIASWDMPRRTSQLGPSCTFEEFWKAWEGGKLMSMFDRLWPDLDTVGSPEYEILIRLRSFLEPGIPRPSIWRLCHFLALEGASVESTAPGIAQAARDYGFSEQLDMRTTMELRGIYGQLLKKSDPLTIHRERVKGNLARFAEGHVDIITPRAKELLQGLI